jgi:hypothetical protein
VRRFSFSFSGVRETERDAEERDGEREFEVQGSDISRSRDTDVSLGTEESLGVDVSLAGGETNEVDSEWG